MIIKETFLVKEHIKNPFPDDMHKIIMRSLEHSDHLSPLSPRSDAELLWSYNPQDNLIVIQHDDAVSINDKDFHKISQEDINPIKDNEIIRLTGRVSRLYTSHENIEEEQKEVLKALGIQYSSLQSKRKAIPIPQEELDERMKAKLEARNINVSHIHAQVAEDLQIGRSRKKRTPTCNLIATVTGDQDDLNALVFGGFGKAKNYGIGLLNIIER